MRKSGQLLGALEVLGSGGENMNVLLCQVGALSIFVRKR